LSYVHYNYQSIECQYPIFLFLLCQYGKMVHMKMEVHMASTSRTDAYNLRVRERRARVFELRKTGLQLREIHAIILKEFGDDIPPGYTWRHVWSDMDRVIKQIDEETHENANQVLAIELERLDKLLEVCMASAMAGDMKAVDRVLAIMQRRSKYLGLDKPTEYQINDWRTQILELLRSGKITLEDVRKELPDELFRQIAESRSVGLLEGRETSEQSPILEGSFVAGEQSA